MKFCVPCMACFKEASDKDKLQFPLFQGEIVDGLYIRVICPKGHETLSSLQEQKFEVLCDVGVCALIDGYSSEAVFCFSATLERFYEFCIRVFLKHLNVLDEKFDNIWKIMSVQSERQLGAFVALYYSVFRTTPSFDFNKHTRTRNGVIHKGLLITNEEAKKFGNNILGFIFDVLDKIKSVSSQSLEAIIKQDIIERQVELNKKYKDVKQSVVGFNGVIELSSNQGRGIRKDIDQAIAAFKKYNPYKVLASS